MNVKDKILQKIKDKKVKPRPRTYFEIVNFAWWLLFILLFVLGSIAVSVIIHLVTSLDWEIINRSAMSLTERLVLLLPYFWLILIVAAAVIAIWDFRKHTRTGYRYSIFVILGAVLLGSIIFGAVIYASGFSEKLDNLFSDRLSFYHGRMHQQVDVWDRAEEGLLIGRIIELGEDEVLLLQAPEGKEWQVDYSDLPENLHSLLVEEQIIRILGERIGEEIFRALDVRPMPVNRFSEPPLGAPRSEMRFFEAPEFPRERF
jgi:hypothetical protein